MSTLAGNSIDTTYQGLIKTTDNAAISGTLKDLEDGAGNTLPIQVSTTGVNFTGTVTGIPSGGGGLVSGTGVDSMESDASLTTNAADAKGEKSIAIGDNAIANANNSIVIGTSVNDSDPVRVKAISIGNNLSTAQRTVNIGLDQNAFGADGVCIGASNSFGGNFNTAVGYNNSATGFNHLGVFGSGSTANATGAYAIGHGVNATTVETVSVKALETQTPSTPTAGGIIITDAGSTARRINLDASGNLLIDSTPVGGGGGLTSVSDTSIVTSSTIGADIVFHSTTIPAGTFTSGDIVTFRSLHKMEQSNGGWTYWSAWISNSTALLSGWSLGGGATVSGITNTLLYNKTLVIHDADGTGNGTDWFSDGYAVEQADSQGRGVYADSIGRTGINWNLPVYINYQVYIDNAGNYNQHRGTTLTKINN